MQRKQNKRLCEEGNTFDASNVKNISICRSTDTSTRTCESLLFICLHKRVGIQTFCYFSMGRSQWPYIDLVPIKDTSMKTQEFFSIVNSSDASLYPFPYKSLAFAWCTCISLLNSVRSWEAQFDPKVASCSPQTEKFHLIFASDYMSSPSCYIHPPLFDSTFLTVDHDCKSPCLFWHFKIDPT